MRTTRAGQSALLFLDAVDVLHRERLQYAVTGALALAVHGAVRASNAVDALLNVELARLEELQLLFLAAGFRSSLNRRDPEDAVRGVLVLADSHANQVNILGGLNGMDAQLFQRTLEVSFRGTSLSLVGREDFIAIECLAGGKQDLLDARSAYAGAQGPLDLDLLRALVRRFGREAADRLDQIITES